MIMIVFILITYFGNQEQIFGVVKSSTGLT